MGVVTGRLRDSYEDDALGESLYRCRAGDACRWSDLDILIDECEGVAEGHGFATPLADCDERGLCEACAAVGVFEWPCSALCLDCHTSRLHKIVSIELGLMLHPRVPNGGLGR